MELLSFTIAFVHCLHWKSHLLYPIITIHSRYCADIFPIHHQYRITSMNNKKLSINRDIFLFCSYNTPFHICCISASKFREVNVSVLTFEPLKYLFKVPRFVEYIQSGLINMHVISNCIINVASRYTVEYDLTDNALSAEFAYPRPIHLYSRYSYNLYFVEDKFK